MILQCIVEKYLARDMVQRLAVLNTELNLLLSERHVIFLSVEYLTFRKTPIQST
jgi:hypothetical protein